MHKKSPFLGSVIKLLVLLSVLIPASLLARTQANISNIRTSVKANIQRIVFDITGEKDPAYYLKKEGQSLNITLEALISPAQEQKLSRKIENSKYISSVEFLTLEDEEETIITLNLNKRVKEDVFSLPSPSRLVIDLKD